MINQQLLDFIKQQLQKGLDKETISKQLLDNGWLEGDIKQGFGAVSTSMATPNINTGSVSNFTIKEKSHLGRNIFLIVFILFLLGGSVSAYYFRNDLIKFPIIKDFFPSKDLVISEIPSANSNLVLDCGFSDESKIGELVYTREEISYTDEKKTSINKESAIATTKISDLDKDKALTCMGKALLNNCQKAIVKIQSEGGTIHTEEILGGDDKICNLKITYQKVNSMDTDEKELEDSFLQCEYPTSNPEVELKDGCSRPFIPLSSDECNFFGIKNSVAHIYENSIIKMMLMVAMAPTDVMKCSGNMFEKIKIPTIDPIVENKVTTTKTGSIDCGTTTIPASSDLDKKANDCMEKQFKSCSLSKENILILDPNTNLFTDGPKTYYKAYSEILGYKDKLCLVKIAYITSQIPEWNNKDMVCNYDNSKKFKDNNMYNSKCSGPLYDAINN